MSTDSVVCEDTLRIDPVRETERIVETVRHTVFSDLKRRGVVVGLSGGIDSSVVAALCARALGKERVMALFTPEADSSPDSLRLGQLMASMLGIRTVAEDISPLLSGFGAYRRRDEAIRTVAPAYGDEDKSKIVLPDLLGGGYSLFSVVIESPSGEVSKVRLTAEACLGIVAATNCKQRARKLVEYYYADLLQYAVAGTPNRLEYELGFFVKNGDGAADFKPIAHLYKSQVYQIAEYLRVPAEIRERVPTTDTYSLEQSQEEFYFSVPLAKLDVCLYAANNQLPTSETARLAGLTAEQVERVYGVIASRRRAAHYLHAAPALVAELRVRLYEVAAHERQ